MKRVIILLLMFFVFNSAYSQNIVPGEGVGPFKIGQSYEEMSFILGFKGEIKTYDDYLNEVLFTEDPADALECLIGFDYYIKFEHLLTLPVSYVYFKNNEINQIRVTSLPVYYRSIAEDINTLEEVHFWEYKEKVHEVFGEPDLVKDYNDFMFKAWFYFKKGIVLNFRDGKYRAAHIYKFPGAGPVREFSNN